MCCHLTSSNSDRFLTLTFMEKKVDLCASRTRLCSPYQPTLPVHWLKESATSLLFIEGCQSRSFNEQQGVYRINLLSNCSHQLFGWLQNRQYCLPSSLVLHKGCLFISDKVRCNLFQLTLTESITTLSQICIPSHVSIGWRSLLFINDKLTALPGMLDLDTYQVDLNTTPVTVEKIFHNLPGVTEEGVMAAGM